MSEDAVSDGLRRAIEILRNDAGGRHFDPEVLQSRLDDLMAGAGLSAPRPATSGEETGRRQANSEAVEDRGPGAPEKALHYAKILECPNPLGEGPVHAIYRGEIDALARGRAPKGLDNPDAGPSPGGDAPASLTDRLERDLALLRQVAGELRIHNELMGRPDAPNREGRQMPLVWLADLYVELTGKDIDPVGAAACGGIAVHPVLPLRAGTLPAAKGDPHGGPVEGVEAPEGRRTGLDSMTNFAVKTP